MTAGHPSGDWACRERDCAAARCACVAVDADYDYRFCVSGLYEAASVISYRGAGVLRLLSGGIWVCEGSILSSHYCTSLPFDCLSKYGGVP